MTFRKRGVHLEGHIWVSKITQEEMATTLALDPNTFVWILRPVIGGEWLQSWAGINSTLNLLEKFGIFMCLNLEFFFTTIRTD